MNSITDLFKNFFTHKDFLPSASEMAGTMFTPLHFIFSGIVLAVVIIGALLLAKKSEKTIRITFGIIWAWVVIFEVIKIIWETYSGASVRFEWYGMLPLYPCSIFMYAMPFAVFGKDWVRYAACGYVCTLGVLGGSINFFYPANILSNYSCISFAGFHTFFYHGALLFCAIVMLKSGYHSFKKATRAWHLLLPAIPALIVSIPANIVNFSKVDSDYMFFKLESFFVAPIGNALPDGLTVIIVYFLYLLFHALPYLPFYFKNRKVENISI